MKDEAVNWWLVIPHFHGFILHPFSRQFGSPVIRQSSVRPGMNQGISSFDSTDPRNWG
jgi:hypothetical protein